MGSEGTKHCRVKTKVEIREVCPKLNNKTQLDDVPPIVDDSVFYKTLCIIEISLSLQPSTKALSPWERTKRCKFWSRTRETAGRECGRTMVLRALSPPPI